MHFLKCHFHHLIPLISGPMFPHFMNASFFKLVIVQISLDD